MRPLLYREDSEEARVFPGRTGRTLRGEDIMSELAFVRECIEKRQFKLISANDAIHDFAELSYEEVRSMKVLTDLLREEGFAVETGLAQMPTCFTGRWGSGRPVVGILGEFDALDQLSQESGNPVRKPLEEGAPGHGCGHCSLGVGALAAAVAVKEYLRANDLPGTVIYFGCPAEEGAGAKQFMARDGMFDEVDFVYTWHPDSVNAVRNASTNAIMGANFSFYGRAAHAGANPWLGRSALDAAELMSVGCNYLREHIEDGERIHYAYANAGGGAPNVVPDHAKVKYEVRAPKVKQIKRLFERVVKVAEGAAHMTETTMEYEVTMAFSDMENNSVLAAIAGECLQEVGAPGWDDQDYALAKAFLESYDETSAGAIREQLKEEFGDERLEEILERPLHSGVCLFDPKHHVQEGGSTDVGDVTYTVPTCELRIACFCMGNVGHTWQTAGQPGSALAHKGLLTAGEAIALACIRTMQRPEEIEKAKRETLQRNGGRYECPLPDTVVPPVGRY